MKNRVLVLLVSLFTIGALAQSGGELHFCLRSEPKTFNPLLAADDASETVRYLTGGVLVRVNRLTQDLEPGLATAWKVSDGGRTITFPSPRRAAIFPTEPRLLRTTWLTPFSSSWIPRCTRPRETHFDRRKAR